MGKYVEQERAKQDGWILCREWIFGWWVSMKRNGIGSAYTTVVMGGVCL